LAIEQEADVAVGAEPKEQIVNDGNQARQEDAVGEIPLPIPVGVGDQVKAEPR
jgi:hypothetical protein